jgi:lysophospholipase L1-like esterase
MEVKYKPLWKKIMYGAATLFLAVLLAELALGIYFSVKDGNEMVETVHDEPYLYYLYDEGETTNQHGFKTSYPIEKPIGTYRIILIGGSVARGKEAEQSISHFLEKELTQRYNTDKIEVLNAGVSGYVLQQEFILVQSVLQHYKPDMIIGLDGYNDLLTYYLNQSLETNIALPPHQWRDFRVIKDNRFRKKPYSRFAYFFKNFNRVKESLIRTKDLNSEEWLKTHTDNPCGALCTSYWQLTDDIQDFCRAKGIWYVQFLQPIKFEAEMPMQGQAKEISEQLYAEVDSSSGPRPYAFSLLEVVNDDRSLIYDDCHLLPKGNERVANAMADSLAPVFYQIFR